MFALTRSLDLPDISFSPATPFRPISKPGTDRPRYFLEHYIFTCEKYFILSLSLGIFLVHCLLKDTLCPGFCENWDWQSYMKNSFFSLQLPVSSFFDFQQKWIEVERKSFDFLFFPSSFNAILFFWLFSLAVGLFKKNSYCEVFEDNSPIQWVDVGWDSDQSGYWLDYKDVLSGLYNLQWLRPLSDGDSDGPLSLMALFEPAIRESPILSWIAIPLGRRFSPTESRFSPSTFEKKR